MQIIDVKTQILYAWNHNALTLVQLYLWIGKHENQIIWNLIRISYWPNYELRFWCMVLWKFGSNACVAKSHNAFFFGVHIYAPVAATKLGMDWTECREKRRLNMLRLPNRVYAMDNFRLPKYFMTGTSTSVSTHGVPKWNIKPPHYGST